MAHLCLSTGIAAGSEFGLQSRGSIVRVMLNIGHLWNTMSLNSASGDDVDVEICELTDEI